MRYGFIGFIYIADVIFSLKILIDGLAERISLLCFSTFDSDRDDFFGQCSFFVRNGSENNGIAFDFM